MHKHLFRNYQEKTLHWEGEAVEMARIKVEHDLLWNNFTAEVNLLGLQKQELKAAKYFRRKGNAGTGMHIAGVYENESRDSAPVIINFSSRFDKFFCPLFIWWLVGDGTVSDQCNFQFHFEHVAKDTKKFRRNGFARWLP